MIATTTMANNKSERSRRRPIARVALGGSGTAMSEAAAGKGDANAGATGRTSGVADGLATGSPRSPENGDSVGGGAGGRCQGAAGNGAIAAAGGATAAAARPLAGRAGGSGTRSLGRSARVAGSVDERGALGASWVRERRWSSAVRRWACAISSPNSDAR